MSTSKVGELSYADIRKMRRGTNTTEVYNFPFLNDARIGVRVLTQEEIFRSSIYGQKQAKKEDMEGDVNISMFFTTRKLLQKACTVGETDTPFFANINEVGELTADEIDGLFDLYNRTQEKYAPMQSLESEEDFNKLIGDIKKKSLFSKSLSSYTIEKLLYFMIEKEKKSPIDNGTTSGQLKKDKKKSKIEIQVREAKLVKKV